jgi:Prp8 binding protein
MYIKLYYNSSTILNCSFSQNGQHIVCGDDKGVLLLWQSKNINKKCIFLKIHDSSINNMLFYSGLLYTVSSDGKCKILDFNVCKHIRTFKSLDFTSINDVDCSNEITMTVNNIGIVKFWDKRSKAPIESISHGIQLKKAKFLSKPFTFITTGVLSTIFVWDLRKIEKEKITKFILNKKKFQINSFLVSKNRKFLFVSDVENNYLQYNIGFIELTMYRKLQTTLFLTNNVSKKFIKTSSDMKGKFFGHGNKDGVVLIWSQKTGKIIYNFKDHISNVNQINFHPKEKIFCSCGNDNSLVIKNFYISKRVDI